MGTTPLRQDNPCRLRPEATPLLLLRAQATSPQLSRPPVQIPGVTRTAHPLGRDPPLPEVTVAAPPAGGPPLPRMTVAALARGPLPLSVAVSPVLGVTETLLAGGPPLLRTARTVAGGPPPDPTFPTSRAGTPSGGWHSVGRRSVARTCSATSLGSRPTRAPALPRPGASFLTRREAGAPQPPAPSTTSARPTGGPGTTHVTTLARRTRAATAGSTTTRTALALAPLTARREQHVSRRVEQFLLLSVRPFVMAIRAKGAGF